MQSESDEEQVFVVEKILDKRMSAKGKIQYLVKWKNFGETESTWERVERLECPQLIAAFDKQTKMKKSKKSKKTTVLEADKYKQEDKIEKGLEPKCINGITDDSSFEVSLNDGSVQLVPFADAIVKYPQLVFDYYEFNLFLT